MHREARLANYLLAALSALSLLLLSLPLSAPVKGFKASLVYLVDPAVFYGAKGTQRLADVPGQVRGLLAADIENRLMQEEIKRAAWIKAEADSLRVENQRLRAGLGLKPPAGLEPLWGRVLERDPARWYQSLMVDVGAGEGVEVNAPVLGGRGEGLVAIGRVVEVRARACVVLLLTDELSSVAAYTASASTESPRFYEGLLQGQGTARLRMHYLPAEAALQKGDPVYTSATSATFPPDVLVGQVARVFPQDPFLTYQSVEVAPALDASQLSEVMILRTRGGLPSGAPEAPAAGGAR